VDTYYLKCEHCGFANEVKSEYLVFCGQCNKKMENNFSNWKSNHSGKSFEDYKNEVCLTNLKVKPQNELKSKAPKRSKTKMWFGIIAGIAAVVLAAFIVKGIIKTYLFPSLKSYTEKEWILQDCGTLGLQLSSPLKLKSDNSIEKQLNGQQVNSIDNIESYMAETLNHRLYIMANSFRYSSGVVASLEGSVQGSLREMKAQPGVTGFKFDVTPTKFNDIQGALIKGKWKKDGNYLGFQQVIYVDKNVLWQVMVGYDLTDPFGEKIAEKVIQSINITPNIALNQLNPVPATLPQVRAPLYQHFAESL